MSINKTKKTLNEDIPSSESDTEEETTVPNMTSSILLNTSPLKKRFNDKKNKNITISENVPETPLNSPNINNESRFMNHFEMDQRINSILFSHKHNYAFQVYKSKPDAIMPKPANYGSAGYDLYSLTSGVIAKKQRALIGTGIHIKITDPRIYAQIYSRSGLAWKKNIHVGAGVIDANYRNEIKVILINHSDEEFRYEKGDRIAQIVFKPIILPKLHEVDEVDFKKKENDPLADTGRIGGFGSSGR